MPLDVMSPSFTGVSLLLASVLVAYASLGELLLALRERFRPGVTAYHRRSLAAQGAVIALVLVTVAAGPGVSLAEVGIAWPRRSRLEFAVLLAAATVALVATGMGVWQRRRASSGRPVPSLFEATPIARGDQGDGRLDRGWALGAAVTAGIYYELLYRGLLIAFFIGVAGLAADRAALAAAAVFVLANLHRGRVRVTATAGLALVSTIAYTETSSLLIPAAVHATVNVHDVIKLRALAHRMTPPRLRLIVTR
ncbi:CPBP family glutamic-type intramembrane protease [Spirillospora sp. CA-294931]|uniref:CPBP family glutamic-type intramembrane protease n=1 Tax=Spirillospora sp. CA-294931 TaxID=3240042 RepID=UPI003D8CA67B